MDFSPEIRTRVYKELLLTEEFWRCWPTILQTSRDIYEDARSVLYGWNLIAIEIKPESVEVRGRSCGTYSIYSEGRDLFALDWPDLLSRCQWLQLTVPSDAHFAPSLAQTINNVLYSLCCYLRDNSSDLRSLQVSLGTQASSFSPATIDSICAPLQTLGAIKQIIVEDPHTGTREHENTAWPSASSVDGTVLQKKAPVIQEARAYANLAAHFALEHLGYKKTDRAGYTQMADLQRWVGVNTRYWQLDRMLRPVVFCDSAWESGVNQQANVIEALLDRLDVQEFERLVKDKGPRVGKLFTHFKVCRLARKGSWQ